MIDVSVVTIKVREGLSGIIKCPENVAGVALSGEEGLSKKPWPIKPNPCACRA